MRLTNKEVSLMFSRVLTKNVLHGIKPKLTNGSKRVSVPMMPMEMVI